MGVPVLAGGPAAGHARIAIVLVYFGVSGTFPIHPIGLIHADVILKGQFQIIPSPTAKQKSRYLPYSAVRACFACV